MFAKVPETLCKSGKISELQTASATKANVPGRGQHWGGVRLLCLGGFVCGPQCRVDVCNKHKSLTFNSNSRVNGIPCQTCSDLYPQIRMMISGGIKTENQTNAAEGDKRNFESFMQVPCVHASVLGCLRVSDRTPFQWGAKTIDFKLSQSSDCSCWSETAMNGPEWSACDILFWLLVFCRWAPAKQKSSGFWFWPPQGWKSAAVGVFYSFLLQTLLSACSDMCACTALKVLKFYLFTF